ncbi:hypothetical protein [Halomonas caseinilytica]|uniref:Uncharacterized protein n=1 Tax=Halomonas caseinilytica TaxID=438744 RepID=A0A1M6RXF4_9GAMM|nr:hypothetical protein [Halomonas caseinilytica]SHK37121.1 hypothetical protein SAMN05192556_102438 [Halomonas caseinilytica]
MHNHQLLDHPLFEERPLKDVLEPFGFEVNIETVEPPIDPALDNAEDVDAYANDPLAYIAGLSFEHPTGFTEIHRNENEDDIFSVAVRAKTVFAQLLLCADSTFAGPSSPYGDSYVDVYHERMRQLSTEGFSRERDDEYVNGELAAAASTYANWSAWQADGRMPVGKNFRPTSWPEGWHGKWWKPSPDSRRNLVKAGALILAEIERLDRAAERQAQGCQACGSVPGQHHSPECPAVNAFQAGRIPAAPDAEGQGGEA